MCAKPAARVALVVEDEWIVRDHIVSELKAHGWTVVEAATGEAALALLDTCEVNVLLTDIQLAGAMNGWEVAHAVRAAIPSCPLSTHPATRRTRLSGSLGACFPQACDPADIVAACHNLIAVETDAEISKR